MQVLADVAGLGVVLAVLADVHVPLQVSRSRLG